MTFIQTYITHHCWLLITDFVVQSLSYVQLFVILRACSPAGSSIHGISQAIIWSAVSFPSPGDLPNLGTKPELLATPALQAYSTNWGKKQTNKQTWSFHMTNVLRCLFLQSINTAVNWGISVTSLPEKKKNSFCMCLHFTVLLPFSKH